MIGKTLAALEATPVRLNWGQIFSLPDEARHHMAAALEHPELFVDKVYRAFLRENGVLSVN